MKRDGLEIEERIAEALRAAGGFASENAASRVDALLRMSREQSSGGASVSEVLGELVLRLESLARPTVTASKTGWQGVVSSLNPILGGILGLFGGGSNEAPAALPLAPRSTTERYDMGFARDGGYFSVDRDVTGQMRAMRSSASPAVIVHVEAMDSRSFLERTPEIAEALKRVLLESEGMQSVLADLQE